MKPFKPLKPVSLDFFNEANLCVTTVMEARCTPQRLMETLEGDEVWTQWAPSLKKVEWTCEKPYGEGSTRTVYLAGDQAVKEVFFHWQANRRIAFYVEEGTLSGIDAFAEDYQIESDGEITRLSWTVALQISGIGKLFLPLSRFFMGMMFRRWLKTYKQLLEADH